MMNLHLEPISHENFSQENSLYVRHCTSEGCGYESQHRILDGHFFTSLCSKNVCKRTKINEKKVLDFENILAIVFNGSITASMFYSIDPPH